jgi:uncharacterized MAPEG superfamily protein
MTVELTYLTMVTLFTAVMWIPVIISAVAARGLGDALGYPDTLKPLGQIGARLDRAHKNAVENLVVFAPLVLIVHIAGASDAYTVFACITYYWARIAHYVLLAFAVPVLKSITFMIGSFCQVILAWRLLDPEQQLLQMLSN